MAEVESQQDGFHSYVYVHFGWLCCDECQIEPDLEWAWKGLRPGEASVQMFATRAVERLKADGWIMHNDGPLCPTCAAKLEIH
jgi:hypothetical protein